MPSPAVFWRTLKHLRFRQVRYQISYRFLHKRGTSTLPMTWVSPCPLIRKAKNTTRVYFDGKESFNFNNEARIFTRDWNDPTARKLWLYNLHYMAWIFDPDCDRESWIKRWIRDNPPHLMGNGWEPYPLSLRLFSWCKHYCLTGSVPDSEVVASMGYQAGYLLGRLEFHLDGNHLLENLLAMVFVGFFLDGSNIRNRQVRKKIQGLVEEELSAQFLDDGGHYELSPMYHAILLERMLDLVDNWPEGADPFPGLKQKLTAVSMAGLEWLDTMSVNGRFALFNDACYDAAPDAGMLLEYGERLLGFRSRVLQPLQALTTSGYFRAEAGEAVLIFDAGNMGPDHQMGHAQGDMLSFCLWLDGQPIVVHPGNYEYQPGAMRDYCRSTAAHNTVSVAGSEQAEWWSSHRVGRRGRARDVTAQVDPTSTLIRLNAAHTGFMHLPGNPIHRRTVTLCESSLIIDDILDPTPSVSYCAFFHFHPGCSVEDEGNHITVRHKTGVMTLESNRPLCLKMGWYCPEFGMRLPIKVAVAETSIGPIQCKFSFAPIAKGTAP